jgi:hypothetical protein
MDPRIINASANLGMVFTINGDSKMILNAWCGRGSINGSDGNSQI